MLKTFLKLHLYFSKKSIKWVANMDSLSTYMQAYFMFRTLFHASSSLKVRISNHHHLVAAGGLHSMGREICIP